MVLDDKTYMSTSPLSEEFVCCKSAELRKHDWMEKILLCQAMLSNLYRLPDTTSGVRTSVISKQV
jgi:hypothetical protein